LSPPIAKHLSLYVEILGVLAEVSLMLWPLVMGWNVPHWKERTKAAQTGMGSSVPG
jgi:hypothetical protein